MTISQVVSLAPAATQSQLAFERYRPRVGALVRGIDLAQQVDDATRSRLQHALLEHGVLYFRDQTASASAVDLVA
jgi:taurine dioxygenase